jgi:hypothetical protein
MSSKHLVVRVMVVLAALITLVGCATPVKSPVEPTADMKPTFNAIATESAQTVVADLTKNAPTGTPVVLTEAPANTIAPTDTAVPADTAVPTFTPVPPTDTPTLVVWTVTPRATATYGYYCTINLSQPAYGASFDKNAPFDGKWTVTNTADKTWSKGDVDFKYISGTKFQEHVDIVDLTSDVAKGSSYTVIIDMLAPGTAGRYSATWAFVQGGAILCPVYVTINVK